MTEGNGCRAQRKMLQKISLNAINILEIDIIITLIVNISQYLILSNYIFK